MLKRRCTDLVFALVCASFVPAAAQQQNFAGVWEAKFQGETFMVLKLEAGDPISGTLSGGHIEVGNDGEITHASGGGKELPISNAQLQGDRLSFDWKEDDEETLKLAMRITGNGEAELQFLTIPEGAKMKPIRLTRK